MNESKSYLLDADFVRTLKRLRVMGRRDISIEEVQEHLHEVNGDLLARETSALSECVHGLYLTEDGCPICEAEEDDGRDDFGLPKRRVI